MKKLSLSKTILIAFLLLTAGVSIPAGPLHAEEYLYNQLKMKDYDELQTAVKKKLREAEKISNDDTDAAKAILRDALQLIFSRPNTDNVVSQLITIVRPALKNLEVYEATILEIAEDAILQAKGKSTTPQVRTTAFIVLENIMSELKPDIKNKTEVHDIFTKIKEAKLKVPDDVKKEFRMQSISKAPQSPSDVAAKILDLAK